MSALDKDDPSLGRIGAFSDGVFAFAITLMVLSIRIPRPTDADAGQGLVVLLIQQWRSYLAYAFSGRQRLFHADQGLGPGLL